MKYIIPILLLLVTPLTAGASRLYSTGFEWNAPASGVEYDTLTGTATTSATNVYSGTTAFRAYPTASTGYMTHRVQADTINQTFHRVYLYIATAPSATTSILSYGDGSFFGAHLRLGPERTIAVTQNDFTILGNTSVLSLNTWYRLELSYDDANANNTTVFKLDGTTVYSGNNGDIGGGGVIRVGVIDSTTADLYFDNVGSNSTAAGGTQTSYLGEGKIVALVPNGAGYSNCSIGSYANINEIPPENGATSGGSNICELDTTTDVGMFNMTDSATAGVDSYDTISLLYGMIRTREQSGGTSNYYIRLSANGTATSSSTSYDAGDATTVRTNTSGTTAFTNVFVSYTNPATSAAWVTSGIDSMQAGAGSTDGAPDTWVTTLAIMLEYVDGSAPAGGSASAQDIFFF